MSLVSCAGDPSAEAGESRISSAVLVQVNGVGFSFHCLTQERDCAVAVLAARRFELRGRALGFRRPPEHELGEIRDGILYGNRIGVQWRHPPHGFPPWETVYGAGFGHRHPPARRGHQTTHLTLRKARMDGGCRQHLVNTPQAWEPTWTADAPPPPGPRLRNEATGENDLAPRATAVPSTGARIIAGGCLGRRTGPPTAGTSVVVRPAPPAAPSASCACRGRAVTPGDAGGGLPHGLRRSRAVLLTGDCDGRHRDLREPVQDVQAGRGAPGRRPVLDPVPAHTCARVADGPAVGGDPLGREPAHQRDRDLGLHAVQFSGLGAGVQHLQWGLRRGCDQRQGPARPGVGECPMLGDGSTVGSPVDVGRGDSEGLQQARCVVGELVDAGGEWCAAGEAVSAQVVGDPGRGRSAGARPRVRTGGPLPEPVSYVMGRPLLP
ncbi:hypothetical protein CG723_22035 [Streptomyces sp. CB01635]|nr:hypothetical protein CG723_22035 [Streptomyces sp. CB01635]